MADEKILIVDDTGFARIIIEKTLRGQGYEFAHAENGEQALNQLSTQRFDLVITDFIMPEMNGIELYRKALGSKFRDDEGPIPCPPFVLATAHTSKELEETAWHLGIFAVVPKCNQDVVLPPTVKSALSGSATCQIRLVLNGNDAIRLQTLADVTSVLPKTLALEVLKSLLRMEDLASCESLDDLCDSIRLEPKSNRNGESTPDTGCEVK